MIARPLRVAVTRAEPSDGPLSEALRRRGMVPVSCPVVGEADAPDPGALERAARRLERYDWLVVASGRAVSALRAAAGGRRLPDRIRTAAVGTSTAEALADLSPGTPLTAPEAGARALLERLRTADRWPGRRVLMPRAEGGGRELADGLRALGAEVDEVVAYRTLERPPEEVASAWRAAAADAVVVASPSAARALVGALGAAGLRRMEPVVAIGSTTAIALTGLGVAAVVPPRADFDSMARLLEEIHGSRQGDPV